MRKTVILALTALLILITGTTALAHHGRGYYEGRNDGYERHFYEAPMRERYGRYDGRYYRGGPRDGYRYGHRYGGRYNRDYRGGCCRW